PTSASHLFISRYGAPRDLPSFPTRRSSDLLELCDPDAAIACFDLSLEMLRRGRRRINSPRPMPAAADITRLPYPDDAFDSDVRGDRKSTRLNSSHVSISYAVFCLKKKTQKS